MFIVTEYAALKEGSNCICIKVDSWDFHDTQNKIVVLAGILHS